MKHISYFLSAGALLTMMSCTQKLPSKQPPGAISLNTVLQPVNSSVIASVKHVMPQQKTVATDIQADGYLDYDSRRFKNIAARFSGRMEKLSIRYAYQEIHKGQRIFEIYSPEMVTAQEDLLFLLRNSSQETLLIHAATQKLLLLGMALSQIRQVLHTGKSFYSLPVYSPIEGYVHEAVQSPPSTASELNLPATYRDNMPLTIKEGMYTEKGQTLFNVVNTDQLWAVIKIDRNDLGALKINQRVQISLIAQPGKNLSGKVNFIEPALQKKDKSTSIRIYLENKDHSLKVGSQVRAVIHTGTLTGLWIPAAAVTDLGRRQVIWVKKGDRYVTRVISTGITADKEIQVIKGLAVTDTVASNAAYLTDSESFIKAPGND